MMLLGLLPLLADATPPSLYYKLDPGNRHDPPPEKKRNERTQRTINSHLLSRHSSWPAVQPQRLALRPCGRCVQYPRWSCVIVGLVPLSLICPFRRGSIERDNLAVAVQEVRCFCSRPRVLGPAARQGDLESGSESALSPYPCHSVCDMPPPTPVQAAETGLMPLLLASYDPIVAVNIVESQGCPMLHA